MVRRTRYIAHYGGIYDSWQHIGPLARRVEDLILPLIAGPERHDPVGSKKSCGLPVIALQEAGQPLLASLFASAGIHPSFSRSKMQNRLLFHQPTR